MVHLSELCCYGHINWSLEQAQQQSSMPLSHSFPPMRGGKARPRTGFHFNVQKRHVPESSGSSLAKRPCFESRTEAHQGGRKSTDGSVSASSIDSGKKGYCGGGHSWCVTVHSFIIIFIFCYAGWYTFPFLDQWRSITSSGFVLNKVKGHHHLQLRSHPPLFLDFKQCSVKAAAAHHPIIQKEVDELLAKGFIEPSSGGAGFYSSAFVVPKHTGGFWPILNPKQFNCYMHIPTFKIPFIRHVWQLIQCGDYAFSIDIKDAYLCIPVVKHHCH